MEESLSFWGALQAFQFMRHAFLAGLVVGAVCSLLSVYVVLKRLAFIGQGISHSAFGGVALALLLFEESTTAGLKINLVTLAFCLMVALLIGWFSRRSKVSEDSAIGVFFALSMAAGVIFVGLRERYTGEVFNYLFGNILGVSSTDVTTISVLAVIVVIPIAVFYKELFFFCFDERLAGVSGIPVRFLHYLLLTLLALTIVISMKVVGIILVSAFLVIPGSAARLFTKRFSRMFLVSAAIGVGSSIAGLWLSYELGIPSGATIVIVQFAVLIVAMVIKRSDKHTTIIVR